MEQIEVLLIIIFNKILFLEKQENSIKYKSNIHHITKINQFSSEKFEILEKYLHRISYQKVWHLNKKKELILF
jgi:hypothetical protein